MNFDNDGRNVAVLFGDGATAALLTVSENKTKGILSCHLHSDGDYVDELGTRAPSSNFKGLISEQMIKDRKHNIYMNGREVFKHAVRRFPEVIQEGLDYNNINIEDSKIVNLDNSFIIIEVNTDFMYKGDKNNNGVCEWNQISNPESTNFSPYTVFNESGLLEEDSNTFELFTKIPFNPIEDCGGTGKAFFRFILIDCYTEKSDTINNVLTIYGCGDGVCESSLEDTSSCPGDCQ